MCKSDRCATLVTTVVSAFSALATAPVAAIPHISAIAIKIIAIIISVLLFKTDDFILNSPARILRAII